MANFPPHETFMCPLEKKPTTFMALMEMPDGNRWKWKCMSCGDYKVV